MKEPCYKVLVYSQGKERWQTALSGCLGPAVYYRRAEAREFARLLRQALQTPVKVIPCELVSHE